MRKSGELSLRRESVHTVVCNSAHITVLEFASSQIEFDSLYKVIYLSGYQEMYLSDTST